MRVDPMVAGSIRQPATLQYQKGALIFLAFLAHYALTPSCVEEMDDFLVEWRNDNIWSAPPSKTTFKNALAAIEKVYPRYKGELLMSRAALSGWKVLVKPSHTVPMSRPWAFLLGIHLSRSGLGRLGALLILQYLQCCRPSEVLTLTSESIATVSEVAQMGLDYVVDRGILFLGARTGTKSGRPQSSIVTNRIAHKILNHFRKTTAPGELLSSHRSLSAYNKWIKWAAAAYNVAEIGWTAHSPRAGYASDAAITGKGFTETREHGRWQSDRTLRGYLDVMSVMGGEVAHRLQGMAHLVTDIQELFDQLFVFW
jgi:hypothetical protein